MTDYDGTINILACDSNVVPFFPTALKPFYLLAPFGKLMVIMESDMTFSRSC